MRSQHSKNKSPQVWVTLAFCLLSSGCGNLSGLGGAVQYGCKAPSGVQCQSVSGNYFKSAQGAARLLSMGESTKSARPAALTKVSFETYNGFSAQGPNDASVGYSPVPLRSPPRILRLWLKAWEDADHDLVDQSYVYVRVDQGKWKLDHVQRQVREAYAPLRPPARESATTATAPVGLSKATTGMNDQGNASPIQGLEAAVPASAIDAR